MPTPNLDKDLIHMQKINKNAVKILEISRTTCM